MNDLPEDLAHPRGERASFIANMVTGGILIALMIGLAVFYAVTTGTL